VALAQDYLTTYGPERSAFVVRHALLAAKAADFPIQTFGGTKHFLPQALAAWEGRAEAEEARREANARTDEQRRREREEWERRRRLADRRATLPEDALAALRRRAEETLATDGVQRTRLGYDVLVKLTMDDLLEQEGVQIPASADGAHPPRGGDGEALRGHP
jgi:Asp-tRNA(Asn)/Glu-tRNA(Gln) amidotransferase A subunit family amidase